MKNNQGVTLVELIVVMIIISILAAGAMFGFRSLNSGRARSTADKIGALLDYVRVLNMSKDNTYTLIIEQVSDGSYQARIQYTDPTTGSLINEVNQKLELKNGSIGYQAVNGATTSNYTIEYGITDLKISNNKTSGAFSPGSVGYVKSISVTASGFNDTIKLVTATGKHYIDN